MIVFPCEESNERIQWVMVRVDSSPPRRLNNLVCWEIRFPEVSKALVVAVACSSLY